MLCEVASACVALECASTAASGSASWRCCWHCRGRPSAAPAGAAHATLSARDVEKRRAKLTHSLIRSFFSFIRSIRRSVELPTLQRQRQTEARSVRSANCVCALTYCSTANSRKRWQASAANCAAVATGSDALAFLLSCNARQQQQSAALNSASCVPQLFACPSK